MKMTSAQANKMLRQLSEELDALESQDSATRTFLAATVENLDAPHMDTHKENLTAAEVRFHAAITRI